MYCCLPHNLCICLLYRPPSSSFEVLNSLHDVLCNLDVSLFSHFILVGDFNVDFLSPNRPLYDKLLSITSCFLLQQVVTKTTHFSHHLLSISFLYQTKGSLTFTKIAVLANFGVPTVV